MTISSIRNSHLKSVRRKDEHAKTVLESDLSGAADAFDGNHPGIEESAVDMSADPASLALADDLVNQIEKHFSDETDMLIVEAIVEGMSGKETMDLLGIDEKEYGALNRRIRRQLRQVLGGI
jgi:DNA-directed RNA polymerase specialized sigma24 family protein